MSEHVQRVIDALLVVRFQAGDDAALDELVRRYDAGVRARVLQWLGGNAAVVDDISQEVWMQVFKGLRKLDRPMAWEAWLTRIARAQVALFLRKKQRAMVPLDAIGDPQAIVAQEPLAWDRLPAAVAALGEPYATMLRMRFWESSSYEQIAARFEIPVGTVRSRLHWAKQKLAEHIRNLETEE